jgi:hypothetical protein
MQLPQHIPGFLVLLTVLSSSSASPVYTWMDDSGITWFSDTPPTDESINIGLIEDLPRPTAGMLLEGDFYSVVNQAKRMETQRLLAEKLKAERLQAEAAAHQARAEASAAQQPTIVYDYWPGGYVYPYYPRHHNRHPHKRHKPGRPGKPEHYTRSSIIKPPPLSEALRLSPATR